MSLRRIAVSILGSVGLVAGCGGTDTTDEPTQPAPDVTSFEHGVFEDLPLPPGAEAIGRRSEDAGVVTRSFAVPGLVPRDVIEFYDGALRDDGWAQVGEVEQLAEGLRVDWNTAEWTLRVSATDAPALDREGTGRPTTQLSLVLSPQQATTVPDAGA